MTGLYVRGGRSNSITGWLNQRLDANVTGVIGDWPTSKKKAVDGIFCYKLKILPNIMGI